MTQPSSGIFLSAVLDRPVISPSGRVIGALWDVAMGPGDLLPVVPHLLVRKGGGVRRIPWADIALFNPVVVSLRGEPEDLAAVPGQDFSRPRFAANASPLEPPPGPWRTR